MAQAIRQVAAMEEVLLEDMWEELQSRDQLTEAPRAVQDAAGPWALMALTEVTTVVIDTLLAVQEQA